MNPREAIYANMVIVTQAISDKLQTMKEQIEAVKVGLDSLLGLQYKKNENIQHIVQKYVVTNGPLNAELTGFVTDAQKTQLASNLESLHSKLGSINEKILDINAQLPLVQDNVLADEALLTQAEGLQTQISRLEELSHTSTESYKALIETIMLLNKDEKNLATKAPNLAQSTVEAISKQMDQAYTDLTNLNKQAKEAKATVENITTPKPGSRS